MSEWASEWVTKSPPHNMSSIAHACNTDDIKNVEFKLLTRKTNFCVTVCCASLNQDVELLFQFYPETLQTKTKEFLRPVSHIPLTLSAKPVYQFVNFPYIVYTKISFFGSEKKAIDHTKQFISDDKQVSQPVYKEIIKNSLGEFSTTPYGVLGGWEGSAQYCCGGMGCWETGGGVLEKMYWTAI